MKINFGVDSFIWTENFSEKDLWIIKKADELGFETIDFAIAHPETFPVEEVINELKQTNLTPVTTTTLDAERNLLSDDPSVRKNGVDSLKLLVDINKKLGITIVIVTHQMEVVKQICQKVALLQGGVLVAEGKAEEVFLKPEVSLKKFLGEEDDGDALPKNGVNIKLFFPSDSSENALITKMARELNIDFSIVGGKLEKFRNNVLGTLTININEKDREEVMKYLSSKDIILEVL